MHDNEQVDEEGQLNHGAKCHIGDNTLNSLFIPVLLLLPSSSDWPDILYFPAHVAELLQLLLSHISHYLSILVPSSVSVCRHVNGFHGRLYHLLSPLSEYSLTAGAKRAHHVLHYLTRQCNRILSTLTQEILRLDDHPFFFLNSLMLDIIMI